MKLVTRRNLFIVIVFILLLPLQSVLGWGKEGHKIISTKAMDFLPAEMKDFVAWKNYMGEHSSDADIRRHNDKSEAPRHFIDIDFYKEFLEGRMIRDEDSLITIYGKETVKKIGILPWATFKTYRNLIEAFKEKNRDKVLIYVADLGHYVADGHQPMHTVLNYNGQLSGQNGVHSRYESKMINKHEEELEKCFVDRKVSEVLDPENFIFNYISGSNSVADVLFAADKLATQEAGNTDSDNYYRLMWFRTKYITEVQFQKAAEDIASLIYTAWVEAGKPAFSEFK